MVIVFHLPGGVPVYAFSLLTGLGAGLGLAWVAGQNMNDRGHQHLNAAQWALLGSLVGARLVYVAVSWAYFGRHLGEIPQVYLGGLSGPGALAGGLMGLGIYGRLAHQAAGKLADGLLPLAACMALFAWLGCWLDGMAYGPASQAWWALPARDEWGALAPRLPVQLGGALLSLATLWLVEQNREHLAVPGQAAATWLGAFGAQMLLAAFLRADPAPAWQNIRLDAWGALATLGLALAWLAASVSGKPTTVMAE